MDLVAKCSTQPLDLNILSPPQSALTAMAKPTITAAEQYLGMRTPAFLSLSHESVDMFAMAAFCNAYGYPILVKGRSQGAMVCENLSSVMHHVSAKWVSLSLPWLHMYVR